ncbi:Outer-membrane lipoprotein LolB [Candidatus Electronema halotolerans]|jgi:outer membrane biogenesis lipoprotein LolB
MRYVLAGCCLCILLLGGCAVKLPQTERLGGTDLEDAQERLNLYLAQSCVAAVDGDVTLSWSAYGQNDRYAASLQAAAPALLRLSLNDPLGRPLLLLGTDGKTFTLADNRKAVGYTGSTDLRFVRRFLPAFIPTDDLFLWLSGRVRPETMRRAAARADAEGRIWWHGGSSDGTTVHILAFDRQNHLSRHLVADQKTNEILFEADYSGYQSTNKDCAWPGRINFTGKALEADYAITFEELFGFGPIDKKHFQVSLPPHFTVKQMTDQD